MPVAPHLSAQHAVVLPGSETVQITLEPSQQAVLSVDGDADFAAARGRLGQVTRSEHQARFLRLKPRTDFYVRMAAQLGWHRPGGNATAPCRRREPWHERYSSIDALTSRRPSRPRSATRRRSTT